MKTRSNFQKLFEISVFNEFSETYLPQKICENAVVI